LVRALISAQDLEHVLAPNKWMAGGCLVAGARALPMRRRRWLALDAFAGFAKLAALGSIFIPSALDLLRRDLPFEHNPPPLTNTPAP
jgi:hypothetical protein